MADSDGRPVAKPDDRLALFRAFNRYFGSDTFADLTIKCGNRQWKVHKLVVSANCLYFERACLAGFKEAHENAITLEEDDESVVAAMIYYLYHGDYKADDNRDAEAVSKHAFELRVHTIGDKYGVAGLCDVAADKFESSGLPTIDVLLQTAEEVYSSSPLASGSLPGRIMMWAQYTLPSDEYDEPTREKLKRTIHNTPDFAIDFMEEMEFKACVRSDGGPGAPLPEWVTIRTCEKCENSFMAHDHHTGNVCGDCLRETSSP